MAVCRSNKNRHTRPSSREEGSDDKEFVALTGVPAKYSKPDKRHAASGETRIGSMLAEARQKRLHMLNK